MPRKRMISPDIWTDEGFIELSPMARLLFIGLISHADDHGRGCAGAFTLRSRVFPSDNLDNAAVDALCVEVASKLRVRFYEAAGRQYYQLDRWAQHQYVQNKRDSIIPGPDEGSSETTLTSTDDQRDVNVPLSPNTMNSIQYNEKKSSAATARGKEAKQCLDYYFERHRLPPPEGRGFEPIIAGGRDMKLFTAILGKYDTAAVKEVIDAFFAWPSRSDFSTRALYNKFDTLYGVLKDKAEGRRR